MLEQAIAELFDQQASEQQPPASASIAMATRAGRAQRRRRRIVAVGTPLLAAVAVAAIAVTGALSHTANQPRPAQQDKPAHSLPVAPRLFNPYYAYAVFGWLPAGVSFVGGSTAPGGISLDASSNSTNGTQWLWNGYPHGRCHLEGRLLMCGKLSVARVSGRAPSLDGQRAYWSIGPQNPGESISPTATAPHALAYQYAGGGWATLESGTRVGLLKMARNIRMVQVQISYPVQLVGVPASWRITTSSFASSGPGLASPEGSFDFTIRASAKAQVLLNVTRSGDSYCQGQRRVLDGQHVILNSPYRTAMGLDHALCAPDDHGEYVRIDEIGHPAIGLTPLFRFHLKLLGLDPASWTDRPLN